ncbi:MAG TPA: hypothetical protein GX497_17350 [Bacillus bacterium]|nr:hypothetical protein [Bacillus sp. (in: firmicutes)]
MNNRRLTPIGLFMIIYGALFIGIPDFSWLSFWVYVVIVSLFLLLTVIVDLTKKRKRKDKLDAFAGYVAFLLMSFFLNFPAIKLAHKSIEMQLLLVFIWTLLNYFTYKYRHIMKKVTLSRSNEYRIYKYLYHGFGFVVLVAGGGGFYKTPEYFSYTFGHDATMIYFSIILLLFSYWLTVFATSTARIFDLNNP